MSAEEGAGNTELAGLLMQAHGVDGDLAASSPEAVAQQQEMQLVDSLAVENAQGVSMILGTALPILTRLYPSLAEVYTDEACASIAASVGPVLAKYGVNLREWSGAYKEEIAAVFVCGPIAWATVQGIKADIAARAVPKAAIAAPGASAAAVAPPKPAAKLKPGDFGYVESLAAGPARAPEVAAPSGPAIVDSMTEFPGA